MNPGAVIADRFEIEYLAGEGGMGAVYRARDRSNGRAVAIKVLHQDRLDHSIRFEREATLLAALAHPAIVHYVAHGATESGRAYLVMDWLEGQSLGARLASGRLSVDESVRLGRRVAEALGHAHQHGVIHRDLKPSNLILVGGSIDGVTLVDFGIARLPGRTLTQTGAMLGTVGYMAPEQARGEPNVDARADVFSLGAVLYRCLTGKSAFDGPDPMAILLRLTEEDPVRPRSERPDVPRALDDLVARMLARSPLLRPADGHAVARALDAIAASPPDPPEPAGSIHPPAATTRSASADRAATTMVAGAPPARRPRLSGRTFAVIAISSAVAAAATAGVFLIIGRPRVHATAVSLTDACPTDVCEPFTPPHPEATDVRDLIRAEMALAQRHEPGAKLMSVAVKPVRNGTVDLRSSPSITCVFSLPRRNLGKGTGMALSYADGTLRLSHFAYAFARQNDGLPEPGCGSHAAWLASSRRGFAPRSDVILTYTLRSGRPVWLFVQENPEGPATTAFIDAADCHVTSP